MYGLSPYNSMNNSPMVYNDPNGDIAPLVLAAIAVSGAAFNVYQNRDQIFEGGQVNWGNFAAASIIGASAAVAGTVLAPAGAVGATLGATVKSFAISGAVGGAVGGAIQGFGNGVFFGESDDWVNNAIGGAFKGAVIGGIAGGVLGGAMGVFSHWTSSVSGGGAATVDNTIDELSPDVAFGGTLDDPVTISAPKPTIGRIAQFSQRTIDESVNAIMTDPNKVSHIFASKHNFGPLVKQFGGQQNTVRAILNATNGRLPASGVFNNISVNIGGFNVILRGNVINGIPRIGTMFIP
jgi:hypothetical protein